MAGPIPTRRKEAVAKSQQKVRRYPHAARAFATGLSTSCGCKPTAPSILWLIGGVGVDWDDFKT